MIGIDAGSSEHTLYGWLLCATYKSLAIIAPIISPEERCHTRNDNCSSSALNINGYVTSSKNCFDEIGLKLVIGSCIRNSSANNWAQRRAFVSSLMTSYIYSSLTAMF